jgi:predicted lipoprotein with Yx(FWY)xxD motif
VNTERRPVLAVAVIPIVAIALSASLAACGDDNSGSGDSAATDTGTATTAGVSGNLVSVQSIDGVGDVLVTQDGAALYTNDQDKDARIACTGECTSIWAPLSVDPGTQPGSDESDIENRLQVVKRPDGTDQVTFDGKPLYTFADDSPGQATGDGVTDSFGGTTFTWTAATVGGSTGGGGGGTTTSGGGGGGTTTSGGGGGGGGYGY